MTPYTSKHAMELQSHDVEVVRVAGGYVVRLGFRGSGEWIEIFMDPDQAGEVGRALTRAEQAIDEERGA